MSDDDSTGPPPPPLLRPNNSDDEAPMPLRAGAMVRISGLASKPELNGRLCRLVEWKETKGRWVVKVDYMKEKILLKPSNLQVPPPDVQDNVVSFLEDLPELVNRRFPDSPPDSPRSGSGGHQPPMSAVLFDGTELRTQRTIVQTVEPEIAMVKKFGPGLTVLPSRPDSRGYTGKQLNLLADRGEFRDNAEIPDLVVLQDATASVAWTVTVKETRWFRPGKWIGRGEYPTNVCALSFDSGGRDLSPDDVCDPARVSTATLWVFMAKKHNANMETKPKFVYKVPLESYLFSEIVFYRESFGSPWYDRA